MSDAYRVYPGERIMPGVVIEGFERYFSTKEADSIIIIHCQSISGGSKKVFYHAKLYELGIQELWVKFEDGQLWN